MNRSFTAAVRLRHIVAALLIGAFSKEILTALSWLAAVGVGHSAGVTARGSLLAALGFVLEIALIYLALRGLGAVLGRGHREPERLVVSEAVYEKRDRPPPLKKVDDDSGLPGRKPGGGGVGPASNLG